MAPSGEDGEIVGDELPRPVLPVEVLMGGTPAQVLYAGGAPSLLDAALQVNARLPFSARSGTWIPVVLKVGGVSSGGLGRGFHPVGEMNP